MLQKATFDFLRQLKSNNHREWFTEHKKQYEAAREDLYAFIAPLIKSIAAIDPNFSAETPAKKCLMRIYRDIRFSKDKTPYKTNYGIVFDVMGYNAKTPSYYLHLEPDNCYFGAGFWMPEKEVLKLVREEIDYNGDDFLAIINQPKFKQIFKLSEEDSLKKAPAGYEVHHPMIDFLKLKSFIVSCPIQESAFFNVQIFDKMKEAFETVQPFILFLRKSMDN
jgi:uncharacterized protein (TIGR02453 family)